MMFFGPLILIGLLIAVASALGWRFSGLGIGGPKPTEESPKSPLDIIKERYARGEIDKQEYEEMRRDLSA